MSAKARKRIEVEKNIYAEAVVKRLAELRKREMEEAELLKDTRLRQLKAKLKQAHRRLLAVSKIEKQIESSAKLKAERIERKRTGFKPEKKSPQKPVSKKKRKKQDAEDTIASQVE